MKEIGYGENYKYAHSYKGNFVQDNFMPEKIKQNHPDVEWQDIKDFRNLLIHEYFGVDLEIIWLIIQQDLPHLINAATVVYSENR